MPAVVAPELAIGAYLQGLQMPGDTPAGRFQPGFLEGPDPEKILVPVGIQ